MKNAFFLILGLVVVIGSFYLFLQKPAPAHYQTAKVLKIGEESIIVEVADTEEERDRGLSERESLAEGQGLLFVFETAGMHGFWMKDMNFAIDIIWIDESWQVTGIKRRVLPESFPTIFYPPVPVKYVLEVPAGFSEKIGIDIGQFISYQQ